VQEELRERGYAVTNDRTIGLPEHFRSSFARTYFIAGKIRNDEGDRPIDRERARDVVYYEWDSGELQLREYEKITITDRANIGGKREHARVWLLENSEAEQFIRTCLTLIPPGRRQSKGTFGINLFRTHTNIVTKPHRDDEEFVFIYVLNRVGDGAETHLYDLDSVTADGAPKAQPIFRQQLQPGDLIVFDDERYLHDASPLVPPEGGQAVRDALVCTVDLETTYLKLESEPVTYATPGLVRAARF
jgi:hypothetical protein